MGLLLGIFGGTKADRDSADDDCSFRVRSDIHVLMVGDPGLGKSQMLRAAANVAPRAVFVAGNTSTTAGLTVSVSRGDRKNGGTGDLCVEAGALVLADQGVCCIDELDKMSCEQHSLLEAMEQQRISIAKSGVVTSLRSRTAVLAAANPAGGHYQWKKSVGENLKLNAALLSRFDLVFILLDRPEEAHDRNISNHILSSHSYSNNQHTIPSSSGSTRSPLKHKLTPSSAENLTLAQRLRREMSQLDSPGLGFASLEDLENPLKRRRLNGEATGESAFGLPAGSPEELELREAEKMARATGQLTADQMRRYIEFAVKHVHPELSRPAARNLQKLYLAMRAEAAQGRSAPVTTRHLESLIRLSQARARIDLRDEVTENDALEVQQLLQESLLDVFTAETGEIDFGRKGGMSLAKQVKALSKMMLKESSIRGSDRFTFNEIAELCVQLHLDKEVDRLIDVMRTECYLLLKGPKLYQLLTV